MYHDLLGFEATCFEENRASEKIMIKIGMLKANDYNKELPHNNILKKRLKYYITKEQWKSRFYCII